MTKIAKRLYEQFQPEHYDLELQPDADKLTFTGVVGITGKKVGKPSRRLTLHQTGLRFSGATLVKHGKEDTAITVERINTHHKLHEVRLHTKEMLYPGQYTVVLHFVGKISQSMLGIYISEFQHEGQTKKIIATQFESHHARKAFACVDEPEAKATFQLTLIVPQEHVVLSNTPVAAERAHHPGGKPSPVFKVLTFETTPKMSTYLLAFASGEMHCVEAKTKDGVAVRSWSSVASPKKFLQYSVDEGVRLLEFFTNYFGVAYPLEKVDQIALPDFDAGAMENWGMVTYREIALLADPDNRSISNEQYVSMVVAHELSHQWFGNLVTMKWWDDLWLNESFASFMEHLALDAIHPEWQQWEYYMASDVISTSSRDVYSEVQPVGVTVTDPDLIDTLYDPGIVYAKGGRLLKMLREYIGDEAFRKGLNQYFKQHAYGNATRDDLWEALSKASGKDLQSLMGPWITHPGMPLLKVDQANNELEVSQKRFLLDDVKDDYLWPVPLLADKVVQPEMLTEASASFRLEDGEYVLLNRTGSGHYFVRYNQPGHREYLTQQIGQRKLPTEARINLLNDAFMLARKGEAPLTDALETVAAMAQENRDNVWAAMSRIMGAAAQMTEGDKSSEDRLKVLRKRLAADWFTELGWDDRPGDDANRKQMRHTILAYLVAAEDEAVIKQAIKRYESAKSLQAIPAEIRGTILATAVRHGKSSVVDHLLKEYPDASADIQLDITSALASTKKPEVAEKIYEQAMGANGFVRPQDLIRWIAVFMRNHYLREFTWQWLTKHWSWIEQALGESKSFDYLPVYTAATMSTPSWQKRYHDFFKPKESNKTLERNILVGYADISSRVAWRKREEKAIAAWLAANVHP